MGVAFVCVAIIIWMLLGYVINSTTNNKYGNRLDGINDVKIEDSKKDEMEAKILEMAKVEDVTINIHGKIVYFNIKFEKEASVEEAQNASINCLGFFEEDYLNFYDLQFIVTFGESSESEKALTILGSRKAGATTITWSNNAKK